MCSYSMKKRKNKEMTLKMFQHKQDLLKKSEKFCDKENKNIPLFDILLIGSSCQVFSVAGHRKSFEEIK